MTREARPGRPRASSREVLAEAACDLFLEQGYEQTSIADITTRAGVSRSSFFNYFASKADVLWSGLDERIAALEERLASGVGTDEPAADAAAAVRTALTEFGTDFAPDSLALALVNTAAMGLESELEREAGMRRSRISAALCARLSGAGADPLKAAVAGAAHAGAVLAAIDAWAREGAGREPLAPTLARALSAASCTLPGETADDGARHPLP